MSTLTKLFVALLIVCSLLLTAGIVTYVNTGEVYKAQLEQSKANERRLESDKQIAVDEAAAARQREADQATNMNRLIGDLQTQLTAANQASTQARAQTAQLQQRISVQDANIAALTSASQLQAQNIEGLQKRLEDMRGSADQVRAQNVELVAANADYQRRLDTLEKELQYTQELLAAAKAQPAAAPGAGAARSAMPDASGVITNVRTEGQVRYATVNLGAADRITPGMQLSVIDPRGGRFLGFFQVETVQQNESFGRLEGPGATEIRPDHAVRSRI